MVEHFLDRHEVRLMHVEQSLESLHAKRDAMSFQSVDARVEAPYLREVPSEQTTPPLPPFFLGHPFPLATRWPHVQMCFGAVLLSIVLCLAPPLCEAFLFFVVAITPGVLWSADRGSKKSSKPLRTMELKREDRDSLPCFQGEMSFCRARESSCTVVRCRPDNIVFVAVSDFSSLTPTSASNITTFWIAFCPQVDNTMKISTALVLATVGSAAAFAPTSVSRSSKVLFMSDEAAKQRSTR